jgi:hypothetical protein
MKNKYILTALMVIVFVSSSNEKQLEFLNIDINSNTETNNSEEVTPTVPPEQIVIRDFHLLHPAFRNKVILLFIEAKRQGIDLVISETNRTPERQNMFHKMKLTKVKAGKSKHQHGLAIDVIPVIDGVSQSNNKDVLKQVGIIGEKLGLIWGGRWKFYDPVHFEYKWKTKDAINGKLPEIPDTLIVPDINFFYKNIARANKNKE